MIQVEGPVVRVAIGDLVAALHTEERLVAWTRNGFLQSREPAGELEVALAKAIIELKKELTSATWDASHSSCDSWSIQKPEEK